TEFAVVPGTTQIRFGLAAIKNVGSGVVEEILRARREQEFESLEDFLTRVNIRIVNRKPMESLIKAGAFDRFGDRTTLLHNLDMLLAFAGRLQKQADSGQTDMFGALEEQLFESPRLELLAPDGPTDGREQLQWERELLSLYLSQHPLELFEAFLNKKTVPLSSLDSGHNGKTVNVGGAVTDVREITTKNGQRMAFVKIEDRSGEIEVVIFPGSYQQTSDLWERDRVVLVKGKVSTRGRGGNDSGEPKVMADEAHEITTQQANEYKTVATAASSEAATPVPDDASAAAPAAKDRPLSERLYIRL